MDHVSHLLHDAPAVAQNDWHAVRNAGAAAEKPLWRG